MRNSRMTVLLKADEKAEWEARAARRGVSSSEYIRQKVNDDDEMTADQEAELAALVKEANEAIPKMSASIDRMIETLSKTHEAVDRTLREAGIRK